ncbi:MAG: PhoH family protein [Candidatus Firestonebacteria bacterium]
MGYIRKISFESNAEVLQLFGENDENLTILEDTFPIKLTARGNGIKIKGNKENVDKVCKLFFELKKRIQNGENIDKQIVLQTIDIVNSKGKSLLQSENSELLKNISEAIPVPSRKRYIKAKTSGQHKYIKAMERYDIVFAIGPAGTGKTYLAMAKAVASLIERKVARIILVRPAVEAGEKLGFLPGTFQEKVDPYLRPLYDALYDMMDVDQFQNLLSRGIIEIAPLAYMRGRTLNNAFVILDEAQNTTPEQMKMFLTRLGFDSKAVITGDVTQIDLPRDKLSGLIQVQNIFKDISGIKFVHFSSTDVVRHEIVQEIINAYEKYEKSKNKSISK